MAKATHVKHARKDYPQAGIKKGDEYWWWQFAFAKPILSKTPPRRSQLTQSSFLSWLYDTEDVTIAGFTPDDSLKTNVEELISEIESKIEELNDSLSNMPDQLQESSVLNEYIENLENWKDALEEIDLDDPDEEELHEDDPEADVDEKVTEYWQGKLDEINETGYSA